MKRILYFILPLLILCCCTKREKELQENELDKLGTIDSVSCYNYEANFNAMIKANVMVTDSVILNIISNGIKNTVGHKATYFIKVPPCYGTITFFSKGDTIKYTILGNLLTHDENYYYVCPINFADVLDSLVFKNDSI